MLLVCVKDIGKLSYCSMVHLKSIVVLNETSWMVCDVTQLDHLIAGYR